MDVLTAAGVSFVKRKNNAGTDFQDSLLKIIILQVWCRIQIQIYMATGYCTLQLQVYKTVTSVTAWTVSVATCNHCGPVNTAADIHSFF